MPAFPPPRMAPARRLMQAMLLAAAAWAAPASALEPFAADYRAAYLGMTADGRMAIEALDGQRWRYTLKVTHPIAQLTQTTVFEAFEGRWRPLCATDASVLLVRKIQRHAVYDWAQSQAHWSGDVKPERAGPVALEPGDVDGLVMNLAIVHDAMASRALRYRLVDAGRAKTMAFTVAGKETMVIEGKAHEALKLASAGGSRETLIWVVPGLPVPARVLQRKDGKDEIDLRILAVR